MPAKRTKDGDNYLASVRGSLQGPDLAIIARASLDNYELTEY